MAVLVFYVGPPILRWTFGGPLARWDSSKQPLARWIVGQPLPSAGWKS